MDEKRFPIISARSGIKESVPWSYLNHCENRTYKNHGQTLEELAAQGGLTWVELLAIMEDRPWYNMDHDEAKRKVHQMMAKACKICNNKLKWGGFAYNQDTCWDCFKKNIQSIIDDTAIDEDKKKLQFILDVMEEHYTRQGIVERRH